VIDECGVWKEGSMGMESMYLHMRALSMKKFAGLLVF